MTTPNETSPGEQPEISPADSTPAGGQPQDGTTINMDAYSAEEILAALDAPPTSAEKPAPDEVQPAGEQPQEPTPDAEPGKKKGEDAIRIRFNALSSDKQQELATAYALIREGKETDLFEAIAKVRGVSPAAAQPNPDEERPETEEAQDKGPESPEAIEARIKEMREARKTAKRDFDEDEEDRLTNQIEDAISALQQARFQAAQDAQTEAARKQEDAKWEADYLNAVDELEEKFPEVKDDKSEFAILFDEKVAAARYRNDAALADPRHILTLAEQTKSLLDRKTPGKAPVPPPAQKRATGATIAPSANPSARPSPDYVARAIANASPEEILAAL